MAITIQQAPTTPNQSNADLLYVLTSTNVAQPQFQYVMEVGGLTLKQQANPSQKGVFNIGQITRDLVTPNPQFYQAYYGRGTTDGDTITPVFYEEYGTSTSSSVTYHNGVSGSSLYIMPGVVNPNDGDWNFPKDSFYTSSITPTGGSANFKLQHALTNSPLTQSIRDDEYASITLINGNFDGSTTKAQDIYYTQVNVYDENGSNIQNFGEFNTFATGGGPRTNSTAIWNAASSLQTDATRWLNIGVGPLNFKSSGRPDELDPSWYSYKVTVLGQEGAGIEDNTAIYAERWFVKQTPECDYEGTRFYFLNKYGAYDAFTFPFANSKQETIERLTFEQGFVNYSTTTNSVPYNINRRGTKVFSLKSNETRTAESGYLSQEEADWLVELLESTDVYVQIDSTGTFVPVVIDTATFDYKTNPRTQKLYRLSLTYRLANQKRGK